MHFPVTRGDGYANENISRASTLQSDFGFVVYFFINDFVFIDFCLLNKVNSTTNMELIHNNS